MKFIYFSLLVFILNHGCSVLVGQVKPVDEKPTEALIISPPNWTPLEIKSGSQSSTDIPDAAWQSKNSSAVISINSVCRNTSDSSRDLKVVSQILLSQWNNLQIKKERPLTVSQLPALETTATGSYLGQPRKFQVTVVKSPTCIFDLVFVSPPSSFDEELAVFHRFRDTLVLK